MKAFFALSVVLIFFSGCASKNATSSKSAFMPEWVNAPISACDERRELCASSEGSGSITADANARKSLAQIFSTKIESKMNVTQAAQSTMGGDSLQGEAKEYYANEVAEITEEILEGVEIKARYMGNGSHFSLAKLDKEMAGDRLRSKMKEFDQQLIVYSKENKKSFYGRMKKLYKVREELNARYEFLKGNRYPSKVSWEDIMKKKKLSSPVNLVFLKVNNQEFMTMIQEIISDRGFKFTDVEGGNHDIVIELAIKNKKEYLNVEGFEKYSFDVALNSQTRNKENLGTLKMHQASVGRNYDQALSKIRPDIEEFINQNFDDLNIE
ncbi:MAG: LPP20 family lipoprotein [Bacteriovoracaceae bacterium]